MPIFIPPDARFSFLQGEVNNPGFAALTSSVNVFFPYASFAPSITPKANLILAILFKMRFPDGTVFTSGNSLRCTVAVNTLPHASNHSILYGAFPFGASSQNSLRNSVLSDAMNISDASGGNSSFNLWLAGDSTGDLINSFPAASGGVTVNYTWTAIGGFTLPNATTGSVYCYGTF